jgi:hypothetical protein
LSLAPPAETALFETQDFPSPVSSNLGHSWLHGTAYDPLGSKTGLWTISQSGIQLAEAGENAVTQSFQVEDVDSGLAFAAETWQINLPNPSRNDEWLPQFEAQIYNAGPLAGGEYVNYDSIHTSGTIYI